MIIPVVVVGMGIIPLGPYSWTLLGLLILGLIIADAVVIAAPPIRAPRNEGLSA
jgi:hypothetical protein